MTQFSELPNNEDFDAEQVRQDISDSAERIQGGLEEMTKRLDNIERNLAFMVNSIRSKNVKRLIEDYSKGNKEVSAGAEIAFFNRVVWNDPEDESSIFAFGHECKRENDDGTLDIIRIQHIPDEEEFFLVFGKFETPDEVKNVTTLWVHNMLEARAYVADYLNFTQLTQVELE